MLQVICFSETETTEAEMSNETTKPTAKIYSFPVGGRRLMATEFETPTASDPRFVYAPPVICGSGWYHEEAVQEAIRDARKNVLGL